MLRKKRKAILISLSGILILSILCFMQSAWAVSVCRTDTPTTTALFNFFWGKATVNGEDLKVGDQIRAYVYDVDTNNGCVGFFEVTVSDPNSRYGAMTVYGDDVTTTEKDGALNGDTVHFFFCRNGHDYEFDQTGTWDASKHNDYIELDLTCTNCCTNYYRDKDGDDYGDCNTLQCLISPEGDYTATLSGDCNDNSAAIKPGAQEVCDGVDNDCDANIDEDELGNPLTQTCYTGPIGTEGVGECKSGTMTCTSGAWGPCEGEVTPTSELCDNLDNDCDGEVDDPNEITYMTYYLDADGDGYGDPQNSEYDCKQPADNYVLNSDDCDDTDPNVNPAAIEVCDGIDNDCNDGIDEDDPSEPVIAYETYYLDADGDGYGDPQNSEYDCKQPDGYVLNSDDCDDEDPNTNPGVSEDVYNGKDNDCDGLVDEDCYFLTDLTATGQDLLDITQTVDVQFGLDSDANQVIDPNNWSQDNIVRLQLIDTNAVNDPNANMQDPNIYFVLDVRKATGETPLLWYVLVEIDGEADPNLPDYYPVLSWDPDSLGCTEVNGTEYVYQLIRGLGESGVVLVEDMLDANSYRTTSQDGDPNQNFTILWTEKPVQPPPPREPYRPIFPWPGVSSAGLGWVGFPFSSGIPRGLPYYPIRSGYPSGLSIPSFPGTITGFAYPGGMYPAWTSFVPRFPATFPTVGIFPPVGVGWPVNYWSGYPNQFFYQTGYFYRY